MKASLNTHRQSPRKVRIVADLIRGKSVDNAIAALKFADKRAAPIIEKLLKSAADNARNNDNVESSDLIVKAVTVNKGPTFKRMMPRARGSGFRINKRTSHIDITLEAKAPKAKAKK